MTAERKSLKEAAENTTRKDSLGAAEATANAAASKIQRKFRRWAAHKQFLKRKNSATKLQKWYRNHMNEVKKAAEERKQKLEKELDQIEARVAAVGKHAEMGPELKTITEESSSEAETVQKPQSVSMESKKAETVAEKIGLPLVVKVAAAPEIVKKMVSPSVSNESKETQTMVTKNDIDLWQK